MASLERFDNNYSTTLNGVITAGATSLIVNTTPPAALLNPQWRIIVESEIMLVTAIGGAGNTTLTVTRGQEGTAAAGHANAIAVDHIITAAGINNAPGALTTAGDMQYLGASNVMSRLEIGAAGKFLASTGAVPSWLGLASSQAVVGSGNVNVTSSTFVDYTGAFVTITTGVHRVLLLASAGWMHSLANGGLGLDWRIDGAARLGSAYDWGLLRDVAPVVGQVQPITMFYLTNVLTAASHTFQLQVRTFAGTATLQAAAVTTPTILLAIELPIGT